MKLKFGKETPRVYLFERQKIMQDDTQHLIGRTIPTLNVPVLGDVEDYHFRPDDKFELSVSVNEKINFNTEAYIVRKSGIKVLPKISEEELKIDLGMYNASVEEIAIWLHLENLSDVSGEIFISMYDSCFEKMYFSGQGTSCKLFTIKQENSSWVIHKAEEFSFKTKSSVYKNYNFLK